MYEQDNKKSILLAYFHDLGKQNFYICDLRSPIFFCLWPMLETPLYDPLYELFLLPPTPCISTVHPPVPCSNACYTNYEKGCNTVIGDKTWFLHHFTNRMSMMNHEEILYNNSPIVHRFANIWQKMLRQSPNHPEWSTAQVSKQRWSKIILTINYKL